MSAEAISTGVIASTLLELNRSDSTTSAPQQQPGSGSLKNQHGLLGTPADVGSNTATLFARLISNVETVSPITNFEPHGLTHDTASLISRNNAERETSNNNMPPAQPSGNSSGGVAMPVGFLPPKPLPQNATLAAIERLRFVGAKNQQKPSGGNDSATRIFAPIELKQTTGQAIGEEKTTSNHQEDEEKQRQQQQQQQQMQVGSTQSVVSRLPTGASSLLPTMRPVPSSLGFSPRGLGMYFGTPTSAAENLNFHDDLFNTDFSSFVQSPSMAYHGDVPSSIKSSSGAADGRLQQQHSMARLGVTHGGGYNPASSYHLPRNNSSSALYPYSAPQPSLIAPSGHRDAPAPPSRKRKRRANTWKQPAGEASEEDSGSNEGKDGDAAEEVKIRSKYRGVCWYKRTRKWVVQTKVNGKRIHVGYFDDEEKAHAAYKAAIAKIKLVDRSATISE